MSALRNFHFHYKLENGPKLEKILAKFFKFFLAFLVFFIFTEGLNGLQ